MNAKRILGLVHLLLAGLYLYFALFAPWTKRGDPDLGALNADGGTGFGLVAVVLGVALLLLAVMRLMGRSRVLPGLGVEQLTVVLGLAAWANVVGFIVGWLAVFPTGTGWGAVVAYFPASLIPQLGVLTLSAAEPAKNIKPLENSKRMLYSGLAAVAAVGIAFFPFITWLKSGSITLAAFDGTSDYPTSGPRLAYILFGIGVVVFAGALMRMRPQGLAEPGPNLLHSHILFAGGFVALLLPLATLLSVLRKDGLDPGLGLWLALVAGVALTLVALLENRDRNASGA